MYRVVKNDSGLVWGIYENYEEAKKEADEMNFHLRCANPSFFFVNKYIVEECNEDTILHG